MKLDPAHRSIRISGFVSDSHDSRINQIESMLSDLKLPNMVHAESLSKGLPGNRSLSSACMVEFPSRTIREDILYLSVRKLPFNLDVIKPCIMFVIY